MHCKHIKNQHKNAGCVWACICYTTSRQRAQAVVNRATAAESAALRCFVRHRLAELIRGRTWHWLVCSLSWWWRNAVRLCKILTASLLQTHPKL